MASTEEAAERIRAMRQPENPPEPVEEQSEPIEEDSQVEQTEHVEEPVETEPETASAETEAPEEAESFELEADQFAQLLNLKDDLIDIDDDGVKFKVKVGDEQKAVNLSDLINAYQGDANLVRRSQEISNIEKQQKQKLSELDNQSQQFAQQAATVLEKMKELWVNPYSDSEMKELRIDDPAEYAARREEINDREKTFQTLVNEALNLTKSSQGVSQEQMQQDYAKYLQRENELTLERIPNFKEVESDVFSHALSQGFNENELGQLADHRLISLIHDSMLFHKGKQNVEKKLTKKIPKIIKSGAKKSKADGQIEKTQAMRKQLKKSGKMDDAVALLKARRR